MMRRVIACLGAGLMIVVLTPGLCTATTITEFTAGISTKSGPDQITAGPDGNLWFTEENPHQVARITPAGLVTEFSAGISAGTAGITTGPDHNLWFTEFNGPDVALSTPSGAVTEFSLPPASQPANITVGPDGNLWFTDSATSKIGRITTAGVIKEFPTLSANADPRGISAGSDGNVWFAERSVNGIGRITSSGTITEFSAGITGAPTEVTLGPDGNIWFTEPTKQQLGRITPAGVVTEFPIGEGTNGIAPGPDGNLWYSTYSPDNGIGRITPTGVSTELSTSVSASPGSLVAGPDGNMWFTEYSSDIVGRATVDRPLVTTGTASAVTTTTATLSGTVDPRGASVPTSYHFEYGATSAYGQSTPSQTLAGGSAATAVTAALSGLAAGTTYHYRLVASNATGTSVGVDQTLNTAALPLIPPVIGSVTQSRAVWRSGRRLASFSRARHLPVGTIFSFTLNEGANVTFTFTRSVAGRRVKHACLAPRKKTRTRPACKRTITAGKLSFSGHAGLNKVAFQGRLSELQAARARSLHADDQRGCRGHELATSGAALQHPSLSRPEERYSYVSARITSMRAARRAGSTAASEPSTTARCRT